MERIVVLVESTDTNLLGKKHKCVVDRPTSLQHLFDQVKDAGLECVELTLRFCRRPMRNPNLLSILNAIARK